MYQEFLNILLLIGVGYLFKKLNILKVSDGEVISRIIFNITLPALVIVSLNSVQIEPSLMLLPFIVVSYGLISVLLAYFASGQPHVQTDHSNRLSIANRTSCHTLFA